MFGLFKIWLEVDIVANHGWWTDTEPNGSPFLKTRLVIFGDKLKPISLVFFSGANGLNLSLYSARFCDEHKNEFKKKNFAPKI